MDLDNAIPIDEADPAVREWLATLQGNILKFHGRDHAAHVFFTFRAGTHPADAKASVKALAARFVTSALEQDRQRREFQAATLAGGDAAGELFGSVMLTAYGYRALGYTDTEVALQFAEDPDPDVTASFVAGMRHTSAQHDLADPPVDTWEPAYQTRIDGVLLLAHDDPVVLGGAVAAARAALGGSADAGATEIGHVIRNPQQQGIEHFGFVDGRSQPLFMRSDFRDPLGFTDANGESTSRWKPFEPLRRILRPDPYGPGSHGSFFVFRKLAQDVRGFRSALIDLADELRPRGDVGRAGALVVGRFEDGTPVSLAGAASGIDPAANDFNHLPDIPMRRCPLQAHIRKVNPRGHTAHDPNNEAERSHRIARRSLTYGSHVPVTEPLESLPAHGVGVLFMCYQASIRHQFAFMQSQWANAVAFPQGEVGADALVGQGMRRFHQWPQRHDTLTEIRSPFGQFVHLKGGEFFFAPSLPFFANL